MYIDTHCHLNFQAFQDVDEVVKRAEKNGVEKIIIPGAKLDSSQKAVEIAGVFSGCFAAVGIHPHHFADLDSWGEDQIRTELNDLLSKPKVVAIGEVGIDYYRYPKTVNENYEIDEKLKEVQQRLLLLQLKLASENNLPVILHCREAFIDMLPLLNVFLGKNKLRGVFHCFGGDRKDLEKVLKMGFYVGFDGNISYKSAQNLRDLVFATPLNRILLETDSPYLTPEPFRKERNEPKNVKIIARTVSLVKKVDEKTVEKNTTENACNLFGWS